MSDEESGQTDEGLLRRCHVPWSTSLISYTHTAETTYLYGNYVEGEAMREGSAARYGHKTTDLKGKSTAEGIEALKEVSGSLREILENLAGGIRAGLGYLGADDLTELSENARFIRVTPAGQRESAPHDVVEIKRSDLKRS